MKNNFLPHIEDFLLDLTNNNYSLETVKNYKRDLFIFYRFLKLQNLSFKKTNKKTITLYKGFLKSKKYLEFLEGIDDYARDDGNISKSSSKGPRSDESDKSRLSSRSINRMLSSLRSYLRFLIEFDYKTPLAPDAIKLIKTERTISQVAEFVELVKLVEFPSSFEKNKFIAKRNRAILELLFSSGMRISELVNLNLEDLDLTEDRKNIRQGKIFIMGKGKKQRFVYLTERSKKYLSEYLSLRDDSFTALFIPTKGTRLKMENVEKIRISARYIQARIALYRRYLGIIVPTTPHSLRHGFATYLAEHGASPAAIQHLLGHESLQTTTRYVHASDKFAEESHRKYHPLKK
ncbi:tyrosine-type recombinase/integrase [Candidatus Dojkabacteria bacterium]|nr:tyrosine-type recombinase/integrase [Candidatus Dojkabacteria bacterium]